MSDKRGIIKNIKPVFCRFDMDDEPERRAWQIIQKLSKVRNGEGKNRSYNSIISEASVGYYDKSYYSHEELLERLEEIIHKEVQRSPAFLCRYHTPIRQHSPSRRGSNRNRQPKSRRMNDARPGFYGWLHGNVAGCIMHSCFFRYKQRRTKNFSVMWR